MKPKKFKFITIIVAVSLAWQNAIWAYPELLRPVAFYESKRGGRILRRRFLKLAAAAIATGLMGQAKQAAAGISSEKTVPLPPQEPLPDVPSTVLYVTSKSIRKLSDISGFEMSQDTGRIDTVFVKSDDTYYPFVVELAKSLNPEVKIVFEVTSDRNAKLLWRELKKANIQNLIQRTKIVLRWNWSSIRPRWLQDAQKPWVNKMTGQVAFVSPNDSADGEILDYGSKDFAGYDGKSPVSIVGGDFTSDDKYVYTSFATAKSASPEDIELLGQFCKKNVIVLPMTADPHNDRYHIPVGVLNGKRTSIVANPLLLLEEISAMTDDEKREALKTARSMHIPPGVVKFYELLFKTAAEKIYALKKSQYFRELEMVKDTLKAHGIEVVEIPASHMHWHEVRSKEEEDDRQLEIGFYYTNALQDSYIDAVTGQSVRTIIIPKYGIPRLDNFARKTYEELGFEVRQVNCISDSQKGGAIRCRTCAVRMIAAPQPTVPKGAIIGTGVGIAAVGAGIWWFLQRRGRLKQMRAIEASI